MPDIFDTLTVTDTPAPAGDIFDTLQPTAQPRPPSALETTAPLTAHVVGSLGVGELRRREGQGEISAGVVSDTRSAYAKMMEAAGGAEGITLTGDNKYDLESQQAKLRSDISGYENALPLAAGIIAPGLLPARLAAVAAGGSLLQRVGASALIGGVSGAASGTVRAVPELAQGDIAGAANTIGLETGIGAVGGPVVGEAVRLGGAAIRGGLTKAGTVAELFRPTELTPTQLTTLRSTDTIKSAAGVDVPISLAEAINSQSITRRMGLEGAEPTAEQMDQIYQLALHRAANTPRGDRTPQEISRQVFDVLDPQRQGLEKQVQMSVDKFAAKAANSVNNSEARVTDTARRFFPAGQSVATIGEDAKGLASDVLDSSRADFNAAYTKAKTLPSYQTTLVDLQPLIDYADSTGLQLTKNQSGGFSVIGSSAGQRSAVGSGSDLPNTVTLEEARNLVSELSRGVRQAGVLPGVDIRTKAQMADIATKQVQSAVSADPALEAALGDANKLYASNIGRFKSAFSEGILSDVGEGGGLTGEAIMSRLTGANAESNLKQFTELLGEGATAGKDVSQKGLELVRQAVISTAAKAGRLGGEVNVGTMVGQIEKLPDAVRNRLFPNYKELRDAMIRESSLGKSYGAIKDPEAFLKAVDADPRLIEKALNSTDVKEISALAKQAVAKDNAVRKELSALSLDKLGERNAFDIQKFALDPNNQPKLANLVRQLELKKPDVLRDVQSLFLDDIMQEASSGGVIDPVKFKNLVTGGEAAGPGTPGRLASKYFESVSTVLGSKAAKDVSDIAKAIADMPVATTTGKDVNRGLFNYILNGFQGGSVVSGTPAATAGFIGRLATVAPEIRYRFAARYLTDSNLRRQAMKPIDQIEAGQLRNATTAAVQSIRAQFGKDSPQFKEARSVEDELP